MAEYLSVNEFAELAGVTSQAVYKRLPEMQEYVRFIGKRKYVEASAVELFNKKLKESLVEQPTNKEETGCAESTGDVVGRFANQPTNTQQDLQADKSQREITRLIDLVARQQDLLEASEREKQRLNDHILELTDRIAKMGENAQLIAAQSQVLQLPRHADVQEDVETPQTEVEKETEQTEQEKTNRIPGWLRWLVSRYEA